MTRDNSRNRKKYAQKAREFALRQLKIGKRLRDKSLQTRYILFQIIQRSDWNENRAMIYVGYYFIWMREYQTARKILEFQVNYAKKNALDDVESLGVAAITTLDQEEQFSTFTRTV